MVRRLRWRVSVVVVVVFALVLLGLPPQPAGALSATGELWVTTSPAVPSVISIDGVPRDVWGLNGVELFPDTYEVCFADVPGFVTPPCEDAVVTAGGSTAVTGEFDQMALLQVGTSPAFPATITVRDVTAGGPAVPRDNWGVFSWVVPDHSYEVCYGPVANYQPPSCHTVPASELGPGEHAVRTGVYSSSPGVPGPTNRGLLRVTTSPALPATISIDGMERDGWGLDWLQLAPGTYEVCFSDILGYDTPPCQDAAVTANNTTTVAGNYTALGWINATTSPATEGTVTVDGVPRNDWGAWFPIEAGSHQVCFGAGPSGLAPFPTCKTVNVSAGATAPAAGAYPASGAGINPYDEDAVLAQWATITASLPAHGATSNIGSCTPGTTSAAYRAAVLAKVNAFRALTGVPPATESAAYTTDAQAAALIMAANEALSHTPPPEWDCYSASGATGALQSNLGYNASSVQFASPVDGVTQYMRDSGANNAAVGHRRWVTCSGTQQVGIGKVPGNLGSYFAQYDALKVIPTSTHLATRDGYVSWPNPGLVPVDLASPLGLLERFSVMVPKNHLVAGAQVSITSSNGVAVGINELTLDDSTRCRSAVAWKPSRAPTAGETWTISVTGVSDGVGTYDIVYQTTFDVLS